MYTWERCADLRCTLVLVYATGVHGLTYTCSVYTELWCTRLQGIHNLELCNECRQKISWCTDSQVHIDLRACTQAFTCARLPDVHSLLSVQSSTQLPYQELSVNLHKVSVWVSSGPLRATHPYPRECPLRLSKRRKRKIIWHASTLSILLQIESWKALKRKRWRLTRAKSLSKKTKVHPSLYIREYRNK